MKIGFVGTGRVGSTIAFTCIQQLDVDEIALVDIVENLAIGEAMDLSHAAAGLDRYPKIVGGGDYKLLRGSDIIVVTAGLGRTPDMTRLDLATKNAGIIKSVAKKIVQNSPESKILVITNPVDLMTYVMWKETRKPRNEVFGMGNTLDSMRLKRILYEFTTKKIKKAWILGEHGNSMFISKGLIDVESVPDLDKILSNVRFAAAEVIRKKGATFYGPAIAAYRMINAVLNDTKEEIPASVVLDGEFGLKDIAIGVPIILGKNGVEKIVEYELTQEDLKNLRNSASLLKEKLKELGY
ncbi:malate dehydrogenase [Thermococcus sp. MV5]|uniref:malate dehydrogenase n=1 Tax=Thermococcus sp. MV5 TaxID=1638272 RepID=UPI00143B2629|nr:malate dehydrogenase [Thermococcus sp. MV5]